jgi:hypothetical protein
MAGKCVLGGEWYVAVTTFFGADVGADQPVIVGPMAGMTHRRHLIAEQLVIRP